MWKVRGKGGQLVSKTSVLYEHGQRNKQSIRGCLHSSPRGLFRDLFLMIFKNKKGVDFVHYNTIVKFVA